MRELMLSEEILDEETRRLLRSSRLPARKARAERSREVDGAGAERKSCQEVEERLEAMTALDEVLEAYRDMFGTKTYRGNETHKSACIELAALREVIEAARDLNEASLDPRKKWIVDELDKLGDALDILNTRVIDD